MGLREYVKVAFMLFAMQMAVACASSDPRQTARAPAPAFQNAMRGEPVAVQPGQTAEHMLDAQADSAMNLTPSLGEEDISPAMLPIYGGVPHELERNHLGAGDYADALTTAYGLAQDGIVEANPLLSGFGSATPLAAIGAKYAIKQMLISSGFRVPQVTATTESVSWGAACSNLLVISGAAPPAAGIVGLFCAMAAFNEMATDYTLASGMTLSGVPIAPAEWQRLRRQAGLL